MQVGQLHRVGDRFDLLVESPDVRVGDVGNLFQDELFDLGAGKLLDQQLRRGSMSKASPARTFTPSSESASSTTRSSSARP